MKKQITSVLVAAAVFATSLAHAKGDQDHSKSGKSMHGGVVVEVRDIDYEIVATTKSIQIHVRDHGKVVAVVGGKAKVTLLNGSEKSEANLAPIGDKLEATGDYKVAKGTKGVAIVTLAGKQPATAKFTVK